MGIANETTLSAWYDEYGTDVLRYCFMFLGNRPDAEDATQETEDLDHQDRGQHLPGLPAQGLEKAREQPDHD